MCTALTPGNGTGPIEVDERFCDKVITALQGPSVGLTLFFKRAGLTQKLAGLLPTGAAWAQIIECIVNKLQMNTPPDIDQEGAWDPQPSPPAPTGGAGLMKRLHWHNGQSTSDSAE